jgi:hypothetical protein
LFLDLRNDDGARVVLDSIDVRIVRTLITRSVTGGERKLDVARAVFWPAQGSSLRRIKLWGEVVATKRLIPSFDFSKCSIKVYMRLFYMFLVNMYLYRVAVFDRVLSQELT